MVFNIKKAPYPNLAEGAGSNPVQCRFDSYWGYHYNYILGLYLGDGDISKHPRCYRLRIHLHKEQHDIINRCVQSLKILFPNNVVNHYPIENVTVVYCYNKHLIPIYFPQHGPGLKNSRSIKLSNWQMQLAVLYPERFLLGLLDSDGCKYINTVKHNDKVYRYISYSFVNTSQDIIDIFKLICDIMGIQYTEVPKKQRNRTDVFIRRRKDVKFINKLYKLYVY